MKEEARVFQRVCPEVKGSGGPSSTPMMEREMITMIVDTLPVFYYEKMAGYMPFSFTDLVFAGERIEVGLRRGKFDKVLVAIHD